MKPEDIRPGTKLGKLDRHPIWVVEVKMPKKLLADLYGASFEDLDVKDTTQQVDAAAQPAEEPTADAPEAGELE